MPHRNLNHIRMKNVASDKLRLKASDVQLGEWLVADGGHICMQKGRTFRVRKDARKGKFINCSHGRHYLDHTTTPMGYLIGLYRRNPESKDTNT